MDPKTTRAFVPLIVLPTLAVATAVGVGLPRWGIMWSLSVAVFFGLKIVTWLRFPTRNVPSWLQLGFLIAWPGMDARTFFNLEPMIDRPTAVEWGFAIFKTVLGVGVLYGLTARLTGLDPYWLGWVGMIGTVLFLHFGSFHLLSCAWRAGGVDAPPLMHWPLVSVRLADFWGRRWNTAFRDLTYQFLFKPLTRRYGARGAMWVGFLASGLIHDAVISFPAGGGFGGPTLFFLIQAAGLSVERSRPGRQIGLGSGIVGWLFTISVLLLPAPLLFHHPFVNRIIVPFLYAIGAVR